MHMPFFASDLPARASPMANHIHPLKPSPEPSSISVSEQHRRAWWVGRPAILCAVGLAAVLAGTGLWIALNEPDGRSTAMTALFASGIVLAIGLVIGLRLQYMAEAARLEAARLQAEARAEAQRSAQARTALLGMVSHELRTPLQTMLANVELLAMKPQDAVTAQLVGGLEQCIVQIKGRLDNIAHYTRLTHGQVELRRESFRLNALLDRVVAEHAEQAKQNSQTIVLDNTDIGELQVHGDEIRLHQVLNNYLSNAVKYSGPGRIVVHARVLKHAFGKMSLADAVEISVMDRGPGIPAGEQHAMWEPFVRGAARPYRPKGSGLGLAVVKLLATSAGWDVGLQCDDGATIFFVRVPLGGPVVEAAEPL